MKKKLTILERLMLVVVLNSDQIRSDIVGLKLKRKLAEDCSFTSEEITKYEIVSSGKGTTWSDEFKNETKEIEVPDYLNTIIVERLQKMNEQKQMVEDFISLYEKFIDNVIL